MNGGVSSQREYAPRCAARCGHPHGVVRGPERGAIVAAIGIQLGGARVRDGSQLTGAGQQHEVTLRLALVMTLEKLR